MRIESAVQCAINPGMVPVPLEHRIQRLRLTIVYIFVPVEYESIPGSLKNLSTIPSQSSSRISSVPDASDAFYSISPCAWPFEFQLLSSFSTKGLFVPRRLVSILNDHGLECCPVTQQATHSSDVSTETSCRWLPRCYNPPLIAHLNEKNFILVVLSVYRPPLLLGRSSSRCLSLCSSHPRDGIRSLT